MQQNESIAGYALILKLRKQLHHFRKLTLNYVRRDSFVLKTVRGINVNRQPITTVKVFDEILADITHFFDRCNCFLILLNHHQSAYCKHHFIETALLYIHDQLIYATGSQKISCLCLLDLSAAFDTIDDRSHLNYSPLLLVWFSRVCLKFV